MVSPKRRRHIAVLPFNTSTFSVHDTVTIMRVPRHIAAISAAIRSMSYLPKLSTRCINNCIAGVPPDELKTIFFFFIFFCCKANLYRQPQGCCIDSLHQKTDDNFVLTLTLLKFVECYAMFAFTPFD